MSSGTRGSHELLDIDNSYDYVVAILWDNPRYSLQQPLLLLIVWLHTVVGLHFWLRMKAWYPRLLPVLYAVAVLVPVLALLGFVRAGLTMEAALSDPFEAEILFERWTNADESTKSLVLGLENRVLIGLGLILFGVLRAQTSPDLPPNSPRPLSYFSSEREDVGGQ